MRTLVHKIDEKLRKLRQEGEEEGRQVTTRFEVREDAIQWGRFEDGFPNIFINKIEEFMDKHVVFVGSFYTPEIIFEQISVLYSLPKSSIRSLTFILPYFNTGTMERVTTEGQIPTAVAMARLLSAIPLSSMGPTKLLTFDIHALQERFYFSDNVVPVLCSAMPEFLKKIGKLRVEEAPIAIAFPDEGAHNRFHTFFEKFTVIRCIKKRKGCGREVTIVDGDPQGCHVIIVDDLINTGGTVKKCIECLNTAGAKKVSVFVTHGVFPKDSWKQFTQTSSNEHIPDKFWITDSLPHATEIAKHRPFELISLVESICTALKID